MIEENKNDDTKKYAHNYSGFWVRAAASVIDGFIVNVGTLTIQMIFGIVTLMIYGMMYGFAQITQLVDAQITHKFFFSIFIVGVYVLPLALYFGYFIFMTHKYQATLGKMAVGVRVAALDGKALSLGKIVLRETIGKIIASLMLGIGYIMVAFTHKKQGVHDMMAQSVVTYKDPVKRANKIAVGLALGFYGVILAAILFFIGLAVVLSLIGVFSEERYETPDYYEPSSTYEPATQVNSESGEADVDYYDPQ